MGDYQAREGEQGARKGSSRRARGPLAPAPPCGSHFAKGRIFHAGFCARKSGPGRDGADSALWRKETRIESVLILASWAREFPGPGAAPPRKAAGAPRARLLLSHWENRGSNPLGSASQ